MAEASTSAAVDDYIAQFPPEIRARLTELRELIAAAAPTASEKIAYRMPTFHLGGNLVHFAAHPHHIGFYPTPSAIEEFAGELADHKHAKGSVQFPLDKPLPRDLITRMVAFRVAECEARDEKSGGRDGR